MQAGLIFSRPAKPLGSRLFTQPDGERISTGLLAERCCRCVSCSSDSVKVSVQKSVKPPNGDPLAAI